MRAAFARLRAIPLEYRVLVALFLVSRVLLRALGLRYSLQFDWMFLDDPATLQHHLFDSFLNFHVYPPGMNLLTGFLLALSPQDISGPAHILFVAMGLVLCTSLLYLLRALAVPRWWALGVTVAFMLTPAVIYFENLYIYTYPVAALVAAAGVCLHRALATGSRVAYSLLFVCALLLGVFRSTFHISWFLALLVLTLLLSGRARVRRVLACAAVPLALLVGLYLKNYVRFGSFGATSAGSANLSLVTVFRLPKQVREEWVRMGKLSPMAKISVYAPPRAYLPYFGSAHSDRWPELSQLEYSTGVPNYNHWFFMEANRLRRADVRTVLKERPDVYARAVVAGLQQLFGPSTRWHPATGKPKSPHFQHDQVLGGYTKTFERIVHSFPTRPVGLYWLLPVVLAIALGRAWQLRRSEARGELAILLYSVFQIVFIVLTSSLFTIGESARYRVEIEALVWCLTAYAVLVLARRARRVP
jgi:hypothetical protein